MASSAALRKEDTYWTSGHMPTDTGERVLWKEKPQCSEHWEKLGGETGIFYSSSTAVSRVIRAGHGHFKSQKQELN